MLLLIQFKISFDCFDCISYPYRLHYQVKILSYEVGSIPFSTQYQETSALPAGTQKVTQAGSNGCKTQTYKVLYKNGNEVSKTLINSDTYKPHNQVVSVGTGSVSTEPQESSDSSVEISY